MKISLLPVNLKINFNSKKRPIYAIDSSLNAQKFETQVDAANKLNVSPAYVWKCLQDSELHSKGYLFRYADEVENESGELNLDRQKLDEIFKQNYTNIRTTKLYAIFENGDYLKFNSLLEAAKHFELSPGAISGYLNERYNCGLGIVFKYADEIEKFNKDGSLDIQKTNLAIQKASKEVRKEIYAIDKNGIVAKFENIDEAVKYYNTTRNHITSSIKYKTFFREKSPVGKKAENFKKEPNSVDSKTFKTCEKIKSKKRKKISQEVKEEIINLRKQGKTYQEIASKVGYSTSAIYTYLQKWGFDKKDMNLENRKEGIIFVYCQDVQNDDGEISQWKMKELYQRAQDNVEAFIMRD